MPGHRRCTSALLALALAGLLLPAAARATTVLEQSLESATWRSATVVRGTVESVATHAEASGPPFRLARVRVDETLAGRAPAVVQVRLPGGVDDEGATWTVPGVPALAVGDELVLFLERVPDAVTARPARGSIAPPREQYLPVSLAVGAYHVVRGAASSPLALQDAEAGATTQVGGLPPGQATAPQALTLESLVRAVRAAAGGRP